MSLAVNYFMINKITIDKKIKAIMLKPLQNFLQFNYANYKN